MTRQTRRRGEPLLLLALVIGTWVGGRAASWQSPYPAALPPAAAFAALTESRASRPPARPATGKSEAAKGAERAATWPVEVGPVGPVAAPASWPPATTGPSAPLSSRLAASQQLLLMAGLGYAFLPERDTPAGRPREAGRGWTPPFMLAGSGSATPSRWSGDGWLLVRGGDTARGAAGGAAGYGGSQAGAVVRFSLAPDSRYRPAAYVRLSGALGRGGDREAAFGLSARPLRRLPIRVLVEGRIQQEPGITRIRPAVAAVSELAPQRLPFGAEFEAYGQAGYVGGRNATAFYDAQATVDRPLLALGRDARLKVGGGVWAGGQEGASRIDVGPRASLRFDLGRVSARASADWRFRVAGNAAPGSGPAFTLSAGF